jgi:hypothetical protein
MNGLICTSVSADAIAAAHAWRRTPSIFLEFNGLFFVDFRLPAEAQAEVFGGHAI